MHYPPCLSQLIAALKALPGVGARTAERYAFQMLDWSENQLKELSERISTLKSKISFCEVCGCILEGSSCSYCDTQRRQSEVLCVVATAKEVYKVEGTGLFRGLYHVLGGLLSPLDGRGPKSLSLGRLKNRLSALNLREVILALDSTLEGDATALYLKQELGSSGCQISRLAFGLPLGSSLEYIDTGTLARALEGRQGK